MIYRLIPHVPMCDWADEEGKVKSNFDKKSSTLFISQLTYIHTYTYTSSTSFFRIQTFLCASVSGIDYCAANLSNGRPDTGISYSWQVLSQCM